MADSWFDRLFQRLAPARDDGRVDWQVDARWTLHEQRTLRAGLLLWSIAMISIGLLIWSAYAPLDEVTRGEGRVVPSSQLQVIQSVDGGVISDLLVREGDIVAPGHVLLRIDPTRFVSSLRENRAQSIPLRARAERLQALSEGRAFMPAPDLVAEAPEIVERERSLFESSLAGVNAQLAIVAEQLAQRSQELNEAIRRHEQMVRAHELAQREYRVTAPLMTSGAVSEVELLRLEREVSRTRGEMEQAAAQIKRLQAAIDESERKREDVRLNAQNQVRNELSEVMARLNALSEGSLALADRVKHAEVKAPVRGTIKRLLINTLGGVVQPGQEVVEIVPLDDALVLEARIKPQDIAFLRPGQSAQVRFTAYDFAIYGGLSATLEHIGADTVMDDKGNAFYIVRVRTQASSLGDGHPIMPGMVAQVDILTGKKTVLQYLLKPLLRAKQAALSER